MSYKKIQASGTSVGTKEREKIQEPPKYKVILLNDDYTTMDFVVFVLKNIFHKSVTEAQEIMLKIHKTGSGVAGVYSLDIAQTKAQITVSTARQEGFPLRCQVKEE